MPDTRRPRLPAEDRRGLGLGLHRVSPKLRNVTSGEVVEIGYRDLTAIEIGGRGETRSGGGFFGGGFGVAGAAEGMLIASALNMVTTRTSIDTVVCLQTNSAELFFHHGGAVPDSLRIRMSPIFSRLRQQKADGTSQPVDLAGQVAQLTELHKAGALTDEEVSQAKKKLLD